MHVVKPIQYNTGLLIRWSHRIMLYIYIYIYGLVYFGLLPLPHRSLTGPGPAVGAISRFRHIKQWFFGLRSAEKSNIFLDGNNVDKTKKWLDCNVHSYDRIMAFSLTWNLLLTEAVNRCLSAPAWYLNVYYIYKRSIICLWLRMIYCYVTFVNYSLDSGVTGFTQN